MASAAADAAIWKGTGEAEKAAPGFWGSADSGLLASGGGKKAGTGGAGDKRRGSPRTGDRALDEEVSGGSNGQPHGELPRLRKKVTTTRRKMQADGVEVEDDVDQFDCLREVVNKAKLVFKENENLRLQLAQEENRRLKLELILKTKEIEYLQKQNEELKSENEHVKNTEKTPRHKRKCRRCKQLVHHDSRNCPERQKPASSSEEKDGEDSALLSRAACPSHPFASKHEFVSAYVLE